METDKKLNLGKLNDALSFDIKPLPLVPTQRIAEPSSYAKKLELGIELELKDPTIRADVILTETGEYDLVITDHQPKPNQP